MNAPLVRVGLCNPTGRMPAEMEKRGLPVMLSANALFDHQRRTFRQVPVNLSDLDVALDSAGFVAMKRYGRYPWTVAQYVDLALCNGFTWWSQMDCCVEPEVAADRDTVLGRILATSQMLAMCRDEFDRALQSAPEVAPFVTPPMPILQGWEADDYKRSFELSDRVLDGRWPDLIGIGSVCRRHLRGPFGLWRVLHAVDSVLPPHVKLHLFGVKGSAMTGLVEHPRVFSTDSMAFEFRARVVCRERGVSKSIDERVRILDDWFEKQRTAELQQQLIAL